MKSNVISIFLALFFYAFFASATPLANADAGWQPACEQCNPNPNFNKCDITTSCISTTPTGQLHCACRAGYKAACSDTDTSCQYRMLFVGQEYRVFVKPGVPCDTLCDNYELGPESCSEVSIRADCA
ncbi:hypothetical protein RUND412_009463 [Rhizina undulata]